MTPYIVTKGNTDTSIREGDIIWLSENGDLNNASAGGWLSKEEWRQPGINDFECIEHTQLRVVKTGRHERVVRVQVIYMGFTKGDTVYIVENNRKIQPVEIIDTSYGFYTVRLITTGGVFRLKKHRLFASEEEAKQHITHHK